MVETLSAERCALLDHVQAAWPASAIVAEQWEHGPIRVNVPGFEVIRVMPADTAQSIAYVTSGCFTIEATEHLRHEFFLLAPTEDRRHVEILAMLANFHADRRYRLDLGSVVAIGEPWLPRSTCDHLLICLPYTHGPKFEWLRLPGCCVRFLWALPITTDEASFGKENGLEALEQKFEALQFDYWNPYRTSVV